MKVGYIGCGNMAQAMIGGMISSGVIKATQVMASNPSIGKLEQVKQKWGIEISQDNQVLAKACDILILAVKPHFYQQVIEEVKDLLRPEQILISIAPGKTLEQLELWVGKRAKIIRAMPNTPALVREGMTAVCGNDLVTQEEIEQICLLFNGFGKTQVILERMMDAVIAVSGSSPAYVYLFIEALADGAVREGMPRDQAYIFASQAVLGSARMVLETGKHPGELKDAVCSPGGTTIEAVCKLEETGFRSSVEQAMKACVDKSRQM